MGGLTPCYEGGHSLLRAFTDRGTFPFVLSRTRAIVPLMVISA